MVFKKNLEKYFQQGFEQKEKSTNDILRNNYVMSF